MDKHYLTPLFRPASINVFAGRTDDPALPRHAAQLHEALRAHLIEHLDDVRVARVGVAADEDADVVVGALPVGEPLRKFVPIDER